MSRRRRSANLRKPTPSRARNKSSGAETDGTGGTTTWRDRAWAWFEQGSSPQLLLVGLALLAYANAWPDALVFDDKYFVTAERFAGLGAADFLRFFSEDIWAGYGTQSGLYRPLFTAFLALEWKLFGAWPAGFHLVNILLHTAVSVGVYSFMVALSERGTPSRPDLRVAAFLAAAVFAVHPLHTEVVNSVFNGSELWASLGVLGGLTWLLRHLDLQPVKAWAGLALIYFLSMFMRETAALLPALAALAVLTFEPGSAARRLRRALPVVSLAVPLGIYILLRMNALHADAIPVDPAAFENGGGIESVAQKVLDRPAWEFLAWERVGGWVQAWTRAMQLWVWPYPLRLQHSVTDIHLGLAFAVQFAICAVAAYRFFRGRPALAFGLVFFYITIFPASLFMARFGDNIGLQERFVYLPSIGLTVVLAGALLWLSHARNRNVSTAVALAVLLVLAPMSWARNSNWHDNLGLFEADYVADDPSPNLLGLIVLNLLMEGQFPEAARYCDRHHALLARSGKFAESCGYVYQVLGRLEDSEGALLIAASAKGTKASSRRLLALLYLQIGDREKAQLSFQEAIGEEEVYSMRELRQAQMLFALHPDDPGRRREALAHIDRALELQPRMHQALELRERILESAARPQGESRR